MTKKTIFPDDKAKTNIQLELYSYIAITDATTLGLDKVDIESHGFLSHHPIPKERDIHRTTEATMSQHQRQAILTYLKFMSQFLCGTLGGAKAICHDWRVS